MDKKNRFGVQKVMDLAFDKFREFSVDNLSEEAITLWNTESKTRGFVSEQKPDDTWKSIVNFVPDPLFYSQVTIGLTTDPDEPSQIFAKILICREKSHDFIHIEWQEFLL